MRRFRAPAVGAARADRRAAALAAAAALACPAPLGMSSSDGCGGRDYGRLRAYRHRGYRRPRLDRNVKASRYQRLVLLPALSHFQPAVMALTAAAVMKATIWF